MNTKSTGSLIFALIAMSTALLAEEMRPSLPEMPPMPEPAKEHLWLKQFAGEWESEAKMPMAPDQPPMVCKGTESARMIGGFWAVAEGKGQVPGTDTIVTTLFTIGYDTTRQKYVGTWVDSMTGHLWTYEGSVDPSGRKLILETEGPCPTKPGTTTRFRDVTEFVSKDHRVLTSSMQGEDGEWIQLMTVHFRRKS